jgi:hypothetical protein
VHEIWATLVDGIRKRLVHKITRVNGEQLTPDLKRESVGIRTRESRTKSGVNGLYHVCGAAEERATLQKMIVDQHDGKVNKEKKKHSRCQSGQRELSMEAIMSIEGVCRHPDKRHR